MPACVAGLTRDVGAPAIDAPADVANADAADAEGGGATTSTPGVVLTIAGGPFQPFLNADGRYVAFSSSDATLVPGDTNGATDTFVWDTCVGATAPAGCTPGVTRVSVASDGSQLSQGVYGDGSAISADGRFVVFDATTTTITTQEIYLRDTCAGQPSGCTSTTTLISASASGSPGNGASERPTLSANGRVIAFDSVSTNLGASAPAGFNIFVHDTCVGAPNGCTPSTVVVPFAQGTQEAFLALSGDGRYVAYEGPSLLGDGGTASGQVNLYDTCIGAAAGCSPSTFLLSVAVDGTSVANALVQTPGLNADGRLVAFQSGATNLVTPAASGQAPDIYIRDTCFGSAAPVGCVPKTTLLFDNKTGCAYCDPINYEDTQYVSSTGRFLAFATMPTTSHSVSVFDTCFGAPAGCNPSNVVVTLDSTGTVIPVTYYGLSGDGHYLAFSGGQKGYFARTGF
jgi:hypothetical protein